MKKEKLTLQHFNASIYVDADDYITVWFTGSEKALKTTFEKLQKILPSFGASQDCIIKNNNTLVFGCCRKNLFFHNLIRGGGKKVLNIRRKRDSISIAFNDPKGFILS